MTDRAGKRAGQGVAGGGWGRCNDQPHRRGGRFGVSSLPKQKDRPACQQRATMQSARGGQIKTIGITVDLQENRREFPQPGSFLGDPEGIEKFRRLCDEKLIRRKPRKCREAGSVGEAHLGKSLAGSNPENRGPRFFSLGLTATQDQPGHGPGKAGHRTTIA